MEIHGDFAKLKPSLRARLIENGWYKAAEAMYFAETTHTGLRKDNKTPEFAHQVWIACFLLTIKPLLMEPEATIIVGLFHDAHEDYGIPIDLIQARWGTDVASSVRTISKVRDGVRIPDEQYYPAIAEDSRASIVKLFDNNHNLGSMVGVFDRPKKATYSGKSVKFILPMVKKARRLFPAQDSAYEVGKQMLVTRLALAGGLPADED